MKFKIDDWTGEASTNMFGDIKLILRSPLGHKHIAVFDCRLLDVKKLECAPDLQDKFGKLLKKIHAYLMKTEPQSNLMRLWGTGGTMDKNQKKGGK